MDTNAARALLGAATNGWGKSSFSDGDNGCVELNFAAPGHVGVRDSKLGDASPLLVFTAVELDAWLAAAKAGEFDDRIRPA